MKALSAIVSIICMNILRGHLAVRRAQEYSQISLFELSTPPLVAL